MDGSEWAEFNSSICSRYELKTGKKFDGCILVGSGARKLLTPLQKIALNGLDSYQEYKAVIRNNLR